MNKVMSLGEQALQYHTAMPTDIRNYINERGIDYSQIVLHLLGWNGERITIPIRNREGKIVFFKLARAPQAPETDPKMLTTPGSTPELYGWEHLRLKQRGVVICEGEFDRLALEGRGIPAVTSTAGAGVFRQEWAQALSAIPEIYLCFDRDQAGQAGALKIARLIPKARIIELPKEVGSGGDVTDYFIRLGKGLEDFYQLMKRAQPLPPPQTLPPRMLEETPTTARDEIDAIKEAVRIEELVGRYVKLRKRCQHYIGRCPFHEDRNPSFVVYPITQSFYCFGCQEHGDAISFLMRIEELHFSEALDRLRELTLKP